MNEDSIGRQTYRVRDRQLDADKPRPLAALAASRRVGQSLLAIMNRLQDPLGQVLLVGPNAIIMITSLLLVVA